MILDELVHHGLTVKVGVNVCAFEGNGMVFRRPSPTPARRLPCDLVIAGKGVLPARTFIPQGPH
jgi:nitrite reductase (NADH) large subunit